MEDAESTLQPVTAHLARFEQAMNTAHQALERCFADAAESFQALVAAHNSARAEADQAMEHLQFSVAEAADRIDSMIDEIREQIDDMLEKMVSDLQEDLIGPLTEKGDEYADRLEELIDEVTDRFMPEKISEVAEEWTAELREELDEIIQKVREELDTFRETVIQGSDNAGSSRSDSENSMDVLRNVMGPVTNQLDRVRDLAHMVGVPV